ncbi:phospholipase A2 [Entamoeba marina]
MLVLTPPSDNIRFIDEIQLLLLKKQTQTVIDSLKDSDYVNWLDQSPSFPKFFHCSVAVGALDVVKFLVEAFPKQIEVLNIYQSTPIFTAIENRQDSITKYLIDCGVDVTAINGKGDSLLHLMATREGDYYKEISRIISIKAPHLFDKENKFGETPLHYACLCGNIQTIKYLLSNGANLLKETNIGKMPIHYAMESVHSVEIIRLLNEKEHQLFSENNQHKKSVVNISVVEVKPIKILGLPKVLKSVTVPHTPFKTSKCQKITEIVNQSKQQHLKDKPLIVTSSKHLHTNILSLDGFTNNPIHQMFFIEKLIKECPNFLEYCDVLFSVSFSTIISAALLTNTFNILKDTFPIVLNYTFNQKTKFKYIKHYIHLLFDGIFIHDLPRRFITYYFDLEKSLQYANDDDSLEEVLLKSFSVPALFKPYKQSVSGRHIQGNPSLLSLLKFIRNNTNLIECNLLSISDICPSFIDSQTKEKDDVLPTTKITDVVIHSKKKECKYLSIDLLKDRFYRFEPDVMTDPTKYEYDKKVDSIELDSLKQWLNRNWH